jgi:hypothetical protein
VFWHHNDAIVCCAWKVSSQSLGILQIWQYHNMSSTDLVQFKLDKIIHMAKQTAIAQDISSF